MNAALALVKRGGRPLGAGFGKAPPWRARRGGSTKWHGILKYPGGSTAPRYGAYMVSILGTVIVALGLCSVFGYLDP